MTNNRCGTPFRLQLLHPRYWLVWLGVLFLYIVSWFPTPIRHAIGKKLGSLFYKKNKKRGSVVNTNIELCFPHLSQTERDTFTEEHMRWYSCAMVDYSFYLFATKKRLYQNIDIEGKEHIDLALQEGSNVILLLGHTVFLEFVPAKMGQFYKIYGSYKTSKSPVIDWLLAYGRCRHTKFIVSREEGMMRLVRELKDEQLLVFLPDEDLGRKHANFAPFFGVQKATLNTAARIARLGKAKSFPVMAFFDTETDKYKVIVSKPLENYPSKDQDENTRIMNQGFEELIKKYPSQYMWLMKLFKTQKDTDEKRY